MKQFEGPLFLFGAFTLAGTSVIAARFLTEQVGTLTITAISLFFALLFMLPICRGKLISTLRQMRLSDVVMLVLQAFFGIFAFRLFLLQGLLHTSTGEAGLLTGATPAITAILAWVLLKEKATLRKLMGVLGTVAGVALIQGIANSQLSPEHLLGNLLVLCAAASESLFNIFSRIAAVKAAEKKALNPLVQTVLVSALALVFSLVPAMFEQPVSALSAISFSQWLALVWYGVFVTALAFICWYAGIKRCHASTAAAFSGMMPFTSLILSVTLLGEQAGWEQWAGGALVMLGMALIGWQKNKKSEALLTNALLPHACDMNESNL